MARNLVITDARDALVFRRYAKKRQRAIEVPTHALWKKMSGIVTVDTVQAALKAGKVPSDWKGPWTKMIREYVRDDIIPEWINSIKVAGAGIARKINRLQRKGFEFDETMRLVKAWIDSQGGTLIVDLTAAQMGSIHALLQSQIALGVTSPYILAQRIKPLVGLTVREAGAVSKFMAALTEEGVAPNVINARVEKYAKYLHKNRAARIARTEISNAYNFGQMSSVRQAVDEDWLPKAPDKNWLAGGPDPCDICLENEAAGAIALDAVFPSGDDRPTAHPSCACATSYIVRR